MKTQLQHFYSEQRKIGDANEYFMEIMKGPNPITKHEFEQLMAKNPALWGRFAGFFKD